MKALRMISRLASISALAALIVLAACEQEIDPEDGDSQNDPGNGHDYTNDELSGLLTLEEAVKLNGALPDAPDSRLRLNVKDTIFLMKGLELGARIEIIHDGLFEITGLFIGVENSSFYYDAPVITEGVKDSTSGFHVILGDVNEWDFSFPIVIIPHGDDGLPLDRFVRVVKAEDPKSSKDCSLSIPDPGDTSFIGGWKWAYTVSFNEDGSVFYYEASGEKKGSLYTTGGCCNDDGSSTTVADDPYCFEKFSDGTRNPRWRSIEVSHYYELVFDQLVFYDNGIFHHQNLSMQTNYRPSLSDFCNETPGYDFQKGFHAKSGDYNFDPGTDFLDVAYHVTNPPVYGKSIRSSKIAFSCDVLALESDIEGQRWETVFYRIDEPERPEGWE